MSKSYEMHDKVLIKEIYGLSDAEVLEAEKLFIRSSFSLCKSAKIIKDRRTKP